MPIDTSDRKGCRIGLYLAVASALVFITALVLIAKALGGS